MCNNSSEIQGHTIDPELYNVECPRSVWNRMAVIYHMTRTNLKVEVPDEVLMAACMSYALKGCCASTKLPGLLEMRKDVNEVDVAAVEALIFEYVRPNVILIESCLRLELKTLTLHAPNVYRNRECMARVALALSQKLYVCYLCLYPETCARACLLAACSLCFIEVDRTQLPKEFASQLLNKVYTHLMSTNRVV
ncbi:hypothetical protein ABB37_04075 [Leptomonas pyrrhocoris]|uniref:Uncharacterized protein n=1 Tax=Leptomonas pyrrhocoris TaxID=157538 RepID=A0A0N0DWG8_LEPPY|nr:hypothetical protein ABB37_04075 [Leptomonas pyrrhocoris]XP_015660245.1 hypothetical protein ABB37_04075 [Leptomonas pyrrhocoris]KPA81805.1 hypothetical protein ABB37_04075 [Leptomonas pyrrhocoris]KPA81806.1 hypothetical protein ABB37_04075 [Leptomonas pyrrhocoris]|eukprot:XP_015660244.1 hypothetical protein ABB37_04075 [Leptomonas pyrrhocoris]